MNDIIILHSTPARELCGMIGDIVEEKLRTFKPEAQALTQPQKEYLSRKEVCELLKISTATLHYWTKDGILKGYRIGGRVLYKSAEVGQSIHEIQTNKYQKP
ncbi:MAG: helix-turn-helix domain-containing protein [Bacteroidota bacterium]